MQLRRVLGQATRSPITARADPLPGPAPPTPTGSGSWRRLSSRRRVIPTPVPLQQQPRSDQVLPVLRAGEPQHHRRARLLARMAVGAAQRAARRCAGAQRGGDMAGRRRRRPASHQPGSARCRRYRDRRPDVLRRQRGKLLSDTRDRHQRSRLSADLAPSHSGPGSQLVDRQVGIDATQPRGVRGERRPVSLPAGVGHTRGEHVEGSGLLQLVWRASRWSTRRLRGRREPSR